MAELYFRNYTLNKIIDVCGIGAKSKVLISSPSYGSGIAKIECDKSLNTKIDRVISHTTNGEFFIKKDNDPENENEKVRLGKILQQVSRKILDTEEIENAISRWKSEYTIDTSIVDVSDDIGEIYNMNEVGGSCMAHHGDWMKIYTYFGCKIAYITDNDNDNHLVARAILWHDINYSNGEEHSLKGDFIDRIFYAKEKYKLSLIKWAKENNYSTFKDTSYWTDTKPYNKFEDGVPYLDTLYNIGIKGNDDLIFLANNNNDHNANWWDSLRSTNGRSDNGDYGDDSDLVWAEDVGDMISRDYAIYIEHGNYFVSEDYEYLAYIDEWDIFVDTETNDYVVYAQDVNRYVPEEDAFYCEDGDYYVLDASELYFCEDDGCYYEDDSEICFTEDDETYRLKDNCYCVAETNEWFYDEDNFIERLKELNNEKI